MNRTANLLMLSLLFTIPAVNPAFADEREFPAKVGAIEGTVWVTPGGDQEQKELRQAGVVQSWDTVTTDSQSKVVLQWPDGLSAAMGESSSMLVSPVEMNGGQVLGAQVIGGVFRFARPRSGSSARMPYLVSTPAAAIYPAGPGQAVDFTVEVYDPQTTIITMLAGEAKVRTGSGKDHLLSSCQSVMVEQGKDEFKPLIVSAADTQKIMDYTTIPGTIAVDPDACKATAEEAPPAAPPRYGARDYGRPPYSVEEDYFYEDWDAWDFYPYGFVVRPPVYPRGPYLVLIPGIGEIFLSIPVYIEPAIVNVYIENVFIQQGLGFYWNYLINCRYRQLYFTNMLAFARLSGNAPLLARMQAQLDNLNLRLRWANLRINRLEAKVRDLKGREKAFSGKLPAGVNLRDIAANSLLDPKNKKVAQQFQERLKADTNAQARFAALAGNEIAALRKKISAEPNPTKRLEMSQQLGTLRNRLLNGKLLVPNKEKQLAGLTNELQKKENTVDRAKVQTELLGKLNRVGPAVQTQEPLTQRDLASLRQDLTKVPDPQGRQLMEKRLTALEQSVQKNQETEAKAEAARKQMEALGKQAGQQRNPEKREQLLRQADEVAKGLMGATQEQRQLLNRFGPGVPASSAKLPESPAQPKVQIQPEQKAKDQARQQQLKLQEQLQQQKSQQELEKQKTDQAKQQQLKLQEQLQQQQLKRQQELEKQKSESQAKQQQLKLQEQLQQQQLKRQLEQKAQEELQQKQLKQEQLKQQQQQQLQQQQLKRQQELKLQEELKQKQLQQQQQQQQQLKLQQEQQLKLQQQQKQQQQLQQQQLKLQEELRKKQLQQQQLQQQQQLKQQQSRQQWQAPAQAPQQRIMPRQSIPQQVKPQQFRQPQIPANSLKPGQTLEKIPGR